MPLTRRALLAAGGFAGLTLGVAPGLRGGLTEAAAEAIAFVEGGPVPDQPLVAVGPHVHVIVAPDGFPTPENRGLMANITFVVGAKGVVVVDTGSSVRIAEMAIRGLRALTPKPVVGIVVTHYHGDHWLGNHGFVDAFGTDLPIWSLAGTRVEIAGATGTLWQESMLKWTNGATLGTRIVPPNRDVEHGFEVALGDVTLRMHHHGRAHTPFDLCVEVVEDRIMCVGDVLMDRRIANMDDGSFKGTIDVIDRLAATAAPKIWLPGHGRPGPDVATWQRELFAGIWETCMKAVEDGVPIEGALALALKDPRVASRAAETAGWDRNIGKYVSLAYLEAEQAQF
ncbi:MAG: MBL fold metallo-hydrolase [Siculibacillus sp.]|nr:MBL fold metallo-hydrolase [Siculibacillus sp.]